MAPASSPASKLNWWKSIWTMPGKPGVFLGWSATIFILTQSFAGLPLFIYALLHWHRDDPLRFICFMTVAVAASIFKVRLPGIQATMSANFLFILVGILDLSFPETLLMGCLGGLVQCLWQSKPRPSFVQTLFNFANLAISIATAERIFHSSFALKIGFGWPLLLAAASAAYFTMNTISVSAVIAMSERRNPLLVWKECYLWSFPYYMLGALIAA